MSAKYDVIWATTAVDDLADIVDHVTSDSHADVPSVLKKIKEASSQLYHFPERGHVVPELQDQGIIQYQKLIVIPWRIMSRITGKDVFVLSVLDSRRNVEDILLDRLTRPVVD